MLKHFLLGSVVALALAACGGSDNPDPRDSLRDRLYCNQSNRPNTTANVIVYCLDTNDLPLSGGCEANVSNVENQHVALAESGPLGPGGLSGWRCMWAANGQSGVADGTPVVLDDATAFVCCVGQQVLR